MGLIDDEFIQSSGEVRSSEHKSEIARLIKHISTLMRKNKIDYDQTKYIFKEVRKNCGLKPNTKVKKARNPLTPKEVSLLWTTAYQHNSEHGLIIETLFFTGARNNEFCNLRVEDFYPEENKLHITKGKGKKERFVPIPTDLVNKLHVHLRNRRSGYLFETQRYDRYSTRRIQDIVKKYGKLAGLNKRVFPHLLRHSIATYLREKGWSTDRIAVFLGHVDSGVTERVYAKIGFPTINKEYQQLVTGKSGHVNEGEIINIYS